MSAVVARIIVNKTDDLDGTSSDDVSTVSFGVDGVHYEIDLSTAHQEQLRAALAPFLPAARRVEWGAGGSYSTHDELMYRIRSWAQEQGVVLCGRGRVPNAVIEAFKAAHESCPDDITQRCDGLLEPPPKPE
ncbi:histone-like nucleoid-structuring protein Lsr2 [Lentzea indica]|uniref:histone-like nucleoid-structuring protein Lsr2 n=1 Tax=Lentzea indica TaxID=2604800 RepID=UPI001CB749DE|nr:Lsr2 family protein [Lentzea indica]